MFEHFFLNNETMCVDISTDKSMDGYTMKALGSVPGPLSVFLSLIVSFLNFLLVCFQLSWCSFHKLVGGIGDFSFSYCILFFGAQSITFLAAIS